MSLQVAIDSDRLPACCLEPSQLRPGRPCKGYHKPQAPVNYVYAEQRIRCGKNAWF